MTPHLTAAMLRGLDACSDQVAIFAAAFPDGVTMPTEDSEIAALAASVAPLRLDADWAAAVLLSPAASRAYAESRAAALRAYAADYAEDCAPARLAYAEACAAASRAEAAAVASRAYAEAAAVASRAYDEATATALLRAGRDHGWTDFTTTANKE